MMNFSIVAQLLMTTNESLYLSSPTMTNNPICMKEKRRFFTTSRCR